MMIRLRVSHLGAYMRRWILDTPWGTIRLHKICQSDEGRDFHDHPFSFTSIILRGGYIEHRPGCDCVFMAGGWFPKYDGDCRYYSARRAPSPRWGGRVVRRNATDLHRLQIPDGAGPTWTLVFSSRYFRAWGFELPDGSWVPHEEYHRSYYRGRGPR